MEGPSVHIGSKHQTTGKRVIIGIIFNYDSLHQSIYDFFREDLSLEHPFRNMIRPTNGIQLAQTVDFL